MSKIKVEIQKMYSDVLIPEYAQEGDAGMDIRAYLTDEYISENNKIYFDEISKQSPRVQIWTDDEINTFFIRSGARKIIPTGIKVAIPDGYEIQVRSRSGMVFKKGVFVLNSPGTIDSCYRGELGVILYNSTDSWVTIGHQERIAQLVLNKVPQIEWKEVAELNDTIRGEGGFGSTGVS